MAFRRAATNGPADEILPWMATKGLHIQGITAFTARYNIKQCYAFTTYVFADNPANPIRRERMRVWHERERCLWWSCISRKEESLGKRVIRSWINRRVRMAFVESLKSKGYASDGSRLNPKDAVAPLFGSASIVPAVAAKKIKTPELIKQTDMLVAAIIGRQPWKPPTRPRKTAQDFRGRDGRLRKGF